MKLKKYLLLSTIVLLFMNGCASKKNIAVQKYKYPKTYNNYSKTNTINLQKIKKYKVRGHYYKPFIPKVGYVEKGIASWYGEPFHGKRTANGEIYNMNQYSAAHKYFPINTVVKVTNQKNNKSIIVRINDRGPYGYNRVIDLSKAAAKKIGIYKKGTGKVKVKVLGYAI